MRLRQILPVRGVFFLLLGVSYFLFPKLCLAQQVVLERPMEVERLENGNTLIVDAGGRNWESEGSKVLEVNKEGEVVWVYDEGLVFAHGVEKLGNGNLLIADTGNNRLLEVSKEKEVVWESNFPLSYPNDLDVLSNGHYLVTDRNNDQVVEIDREGGVYWEYQDLKRPHNADRLENGDTLISDSEDNKVIRVNSAGEVVWELGGGEDSFLYWPRDVDLLESGNYLITDSRHHRVVEVTPEGKEVWEYSGLLSFPYEADKLENGNVLISVSSHARVIEVNKDGEVVWEFGDSSLPRANNLDNGSFEEDQNNDGWADSWLKGNLLVEAGKYGFSLDSGVFKKGMKSLKLDYEGKGMLFAHRYLPLKKGRNYQVSGFIKCQEVEGGARIEVIFLDKLGGQTGLTSRSLGCQGSADWEKFSTSFKVPRESELTNLWLLLEGSGVVWFDQVSLRSGWLSWAWFLGLGSLSGVTIAWFLGRILRK